MARRPRLSGKYDDRIYYLDVLQGDYFFLNGMLHAARAPPASPFARLLNAWEHECMRMRRAEGRWPTGRWPSSVHFSVDPMGCR